jgi:AraC-like DNA-binding protein
MVNMSTELPIKDKSGGRTSIKIAPFKSAILHTDPHRHNGYFELIYLTAGHGIHLIDGRRHPVAPPVLFVIRKDQVHCWELETPGVGYVLIIQKEFVDKLTDGRLRSLFASVSGHNCLPMERHPSIDHLWAVLLAELEPGREEIPEVAESVLKALLGKMMEKARPKITPARGPGGLYEQFLELLEAGKPLKHTVQHYAKQLHTTPQNLNNSCRKSVDRSATAILGDFLINEAKRLLLYTTGSVAEISFALDFKDPSHFVKYFRRITGRTPQAFRRE